LGQTGRVCKRVIGGVSLAGARASTHWVAKSALSSIQTKSTSSEPPQRANAGVAMQSESFDELIENFARVFFAGAGVTGTQFCQFFAFGLRAHQRFLFSVTFFLRQFAIALGCHPVLARGWGVW
jgi:hypothetical protein